MQIYLRVIQPIRLQNSSYTVNDYIIVDIIYVFGLVYAKIGRFIVTCVLFFRWRLEQTISVCWFSYPVIDITQWLDENIAIAWLL